MLKLTPTSIENFYLTDLQFQLIKENPTLMACPTFLLFRCRQTIKYEPKQTIKSDRREREGDKNIKLGQKHFLSLFWNKKVIFCEKLLISGLILVEKSASRTNAATSFILILSTFSLCCGSSQSATIYNPLTASNANKNICHLSGKNIIRCSNVCSAKKKSLL